MEEKKPMAKQPDMFVSLSPEEFEKVQPMTDQKIKDLLKQGEVDRDAAQSYTQTSHLHSHVMFR